MSNTINQQKSINNVVKRVLDKMGADQDTQERSSSAIKTVIEAIADDNLEAGIICVPWKDGKESSLVASVNNGLIQMLRLGKDDQVRGEIWVIKAEESRVVAAPIDNIDDHSNHEAMRLHALATEKAIKNNKDAQCMSQQLIGKSVSTYEEPKVPEHLQLGR
jgi:hypothetical protein